MPRFGVMFSGALLILASVVGAAQAVAEDETNDVTIQIKAPLEAADCTSAPPTITVLGLVVDVTHATFEVDEADGDNNDGEPEGDHHDEGEGSCAVLTPGSTVEVKLLSDSDPLEATEVSQEGDDDEVEASIQAPVQAVDPAAKTITLLALTVDASNATLEGDDDDSEDGGEQPIDLTQIVVGQVVEIELDASQLPALVATEVELNNFTNKVAVTLLDDHGKEVNDDTDDVTVNVDQTVMVKQMIKGRLRMVRKRLHFQLRTNGSFVLAGLPKGNAVVKVTRQLGDVKTAVRRAVPIQRNKTRLVKMRLHKTRS